MFRCLELERLGNRIFKSYYFVVEGLQYCYVMICCLGVCGVQFDDRVSTGHGRLDWQEIQQQSRCNVIFRSGSLSQASVLIPKHGEMRWHFILYLRVSPLLYFAAAPV